MMDLNDRRCAECNGLLERRERESKTCWRNRVYCGRPCHKKRLKRRQFRERVADKARRAAKAQGGR